MDAISSEFDLDRTQTIETAPREARVVGPRKLSGRAGASVRAHWALVLPDDPSELGVEWICDGRVIVHGASLVTVEFDLTRAAKGECLRRSVRAVLHGATWTLACPAHFVEIDVS